MNISDHLNADLQNKFEFYSYNHAFEILNQAFPTQWAEILQCLQNLSITIDDLRQAGGNETNIPKKFDDTLYPLGWQEIRISGDLIVKLYPRKKNKKGAFSTVPFDQKVLNGYIDGHNIDFIKDRVAFDLEWNSKDQTFDRDLLAMRTYYECDIISVGIIITRAEELNDIFKVVYAFDKKAGTWKPIITKYGASTTWMGKLLPRLKSRRNGGCPILAIGIKKGCIADWTEEYIDEHKPRNQ